MAEEFNGIGDFRYEDRPAAAGLREFTDFLRTLDSDIAADMSGKAHDVLIEHQEKQKEEWVIQRAANHPLVLDVVGFFMEFTDEEAETVEDEIKDRLTRVLHRVYGVPPERSHEVFGKAEAIIWQKREEAEGYGY